MATWRCVHLCPFVERVTSGPLRPEHCLVCAAQLREALEHGRATAALAHGVDVGWIVDIPGELGLPAADATLAFLLAHAPQGTVAIGLAGLEVGVPRAQFADHVARAKARGLKAVIHAGETTGPETVWSALRDLHADRIGHGTSAVQDPHLLHHLAEAGVPVEVCVSSNLCTGAVSDLSTHPVRELLAAGITVCLSTDDPGMFATDLNREYELVARIAGLDEPAVRKLARASVDASFAPDTVASRLRAALDDRQVGHTSAVGVAVNPCASGLGETPEVGVAPSALGEIGG